MDGRNAGGIVRAYDLLTEHGGAIEADLQRFYGVHIGDFPWPLTARRLIALVAHLPNDSAFMQLGLTAEERSWSRESYLLAGIFDAIQIGNYEAWGLAGVPSRKMPPPPRPIVRPGVTADGPKPVDREAVDRVMAQRGIEIPDDLKGR